MTKLGDKYPNFLKAMEEFRQGTDCQLVWNDSTKIGYTMSLVIYQKKIGTITLELDRFYDQAVFSYTTMNGFVEKAVTSTDPIDGDLEFENWLTLLREKMMEHNFNPNHQKFIIESTLKKVTKKESTGCLGMILLLITIGISSTLF